MNEDLAVPEGSRSGGLAFLLLCAVWLVAAVILKANGRPVEEPVALLVIFGLALPAIAFLVCRGLPRSVPPRPVPADPALLAGLTVFITIFLATKGSVLAALVGVAPDPRLKDAVNTALKLAAFVAVPLAACGLGGLTPRRLRLSFPPKELRGRGLLAFAVLGAALAAIQIFLGRGARPLLDGSLAHHHWLIGLVLCFLWMSAEAGLVEEVFFRVILQSRLAAVTRSQAAGVFLSALIFGLAHAPGLWLRGAGAIDGLGGAPSLPVSIAYSVATMGLAGIVFGILWMRTRNWVLIVALHGFTDALSNAPAFMATWRL
jgi:membrane protease YdiL (CAAX protease family)